MVPFDAIKSLVTLGACVTLDANALPQPQFVELAARAAQTGAVVTLRSAEKMPSAAREQLAGIAGRGVRFEFGG